MLSAHFSPEIAKAAAEWLTLSMDTAFNTEDADRLHQWRKANPEHERAWQHINGMRTSMQSLDGRVAYQTLSTLPSPSRRGALKILLWGGIVTGSGVLASKTDTWQLQMADYSTATGERKELALADGTQVVLNTRSAIDVALTDTSRTLYLRSGEVMVTTGHLPGEQRPFQLVSPHGSIRPLGTRFNVRLSADITTVTVLEGAVHAVTRQGQAQTLRAGQQTSFSADQMQAVNTSAPHAGSWHRGLLFANDMRLADLAQELARYRTGVVECDTDVADLRISGVFPLQDTSQAFMALPNSLPVSVTYYTRYWVRITANPTVLNSTGKTI